MLAVPQFVLHPIVGIFLELLEGQQRSRTHSLIIRQVCDVVILTVRGIFEPMTVTVKRRDQLVVPESIRRRARIKPGDRLEFKVSGGMIMIIPELPSADDEYTREQRRVVDARLAEARKGPYYGPFGTPEEAVKFLRKEIRSRRPNKRKSAKR